MLDELKEVLLKGLRTVGSTVGVVMYFHSFVGAEAAVTALANGRWHGRDPVAGVYVSAVDQARPAVGDQEGVAAPLSRGEVGGNQLRSFRPWPAGICIASKCGKLAGVSDVRVCDAISEFYRIKSAQHCNCGSLIGLLL
jgi:hypothetical protein